MCIRDRNYGMAADRKTVYSDIDIIQVRGTNGDVIAAAENLNY